VTAPGGPISSEVIAMQLALSLSLAALGSVGELAVRVAVAFRGRPMVSSPK